MEITMANGTFRLKSRELYAVRGLANRTVKNKLDVSKKAGWSYATSHMWVEKPEKLTSVSFDNLAIFLFDVLEMDPEEVLNMRFGEFFNYVPKDQQEGPAE